MLNIDWSQLNKVITDKFGRVNGIFAINKPIGITSHDVVDQVRRKLGTRKVGHAGALDPFASGLLLILVGRFTKKTEMLIKLDKTYRTKVLLGVGTDSGDIDGQVTDIDKDFKLDESKLREVIESLNQKYDQYVPIFSSVKVDGIKLREAARSSTEHKIVYDEPRKAIFNLGNTATGKLKQRAKDNIWEVEIPSKEVTVDIRVQNIEKVHPSELDFEIFKDLKQKFYSIELEIDCSKGTYIRGLADDIGRMLGSFGVLYELERTRIGDVDIQKAISVDAIKF